MIVSTYLLDSGLFGGFRDLDKVPQNMGVATNMYENQFVKPLWNDTEWIEGATPAEIAEANKPIVQDLKLQQHEELLPTDWYYTRYIETGQEVPLEIKQQRQQIREKYNNLTNEISNE